MRNLKVLFLILVLAPGFTAILNGCKEGENTVITPIDPNPPVYNPTQIFSKSFGSNLSDLVTGVAQANDGGVVLCGYTISTVFGDNDIFIMKLDHTGAIAWCNIYGGFGNDQANSIQKTSDGKFIIGGSSNSYSGTFDPIAIKIDASGVIEWSKYYRWWNEDYGNNIIQTSDGGYIMTGQSNSFGAGENDVYSLKLDQSGGIMWCRCYGGIFSEYGSSIRQAPDGGYIIGGYTNSFGLFGDAYIIKLWGDGAIKWSKTYGGDGYDNIKDLNNSSNGFIACGSTFSFGLSNEDALVFNIDNGDGFVYWARTFGGNNGGIDQFTKIFQTSEGGLLAGGFMQNNGKDGNDFAVVKLFGDGAFNWAKSFGGVGNDFVLAMSVKQDGGFLVAGPTASFGAGANDVYLQSIKADGTGCLTDEQVTPAAGSPTLTVVAASTSYFDINFYETNPVTLQTAPFNVVQNTQCIIAP